MRTPTTRSQKIRSSLYRRLQLLRGWQWRICGVAAGERFGVGRAVRIDYPEYLVVGNDVTIEDLAFMHCLSTRGVHIGNYTSIDRNLWLHCGGTPGNRDHGFFEIGDNSFIGCSAVIGAGGGICIGNHVLIGQNVNIHAENHRFDDPDRLIEEQGVDYQGVKIEDDVWIGSKATILDGVTIGRGAVVGAGSLVTKSVPQFAVAVGVPARVIRSRGRDEHRQ